MAVDPIYVGKSVCVVNPDDDNGSVLPAVIQRISPEDMDVCDVAVFGSCYYVLNGVRRSDVAAPGRWFVPNTGG
ncbi:MAG TPA: hypothetical protein VFJ24_11900 [Gaiellales bacterium]|nr:hypothetical protein [Gaiellales bacterium]